jgi:hypothetical protein
MKDQLQDHITAVKNLALEQSDDLIGLLGILRKLESLHREIREDLFEVALPNNRHDLYDILKEIEEGGGWPYIKRMRILELLRNIDELRQAEEDQFSDNKEI